MEQEQRLKKMEMTNVVLEIEQDALNRGDMTISCCKSDMSVITTLTQMHIINFM